MTYTEVLFMLGRVLLGGYFLMSASNHFLRAGMLSGYAASKGVPMPGAAVFISGLLLLTGGLGVLLGVYVEWAIGAIVLFLVPVTCMMHRFWTVSDPMARMGDMVNFTKNLALLGAVLMLLSIAIPWPYHLF